MDNPAATVPVGVVAAAMVFAAMVSHRRALQAPLIVALLGGGEAAAPRQDRQRRGKDAELLHGVGPSTGPAGDILAGRCSIAWKEMTPNCAGFATYIYRFPAISVHVSVFVRRAPCNPVFPG
jgi:hypothetical protein